MDLYYKGDKIHELVYNEGSDCPITPSEPTEGFSLKRYGYDTDIDDNLQWYIDYCDTCYRIISEELRNGSTSLDNRLQWQPVLFLPKYDTSNVTSMREFCMGTNVVSIPKFNLSKVKDMYRAFGSNGNLMFIPQFDLSGVENLRGTFAQNGSLGTIPELDTSNATDLSGFVQECYNLKRVEGISYKSISGDYWIFDNSDAYEEWFTYNESCTYILIKDIGYHPNLTSLNTVSSQVWGDEERWGWESEGSRQSLVDSLLTYSYDRKKAGYPDCTITLSEYTYGRLSDSERASIEAKGYKLESKPREW